MQPPSVAIFFMTYLYRAGGGVVAPLPPPGHNYWDYVPTLGHSPELCLTHAAVDYCY